MERRDEQILKARLREYRALVRRLIAEIREITDRDWWCDDDDDEWE